MASGKTDVDPEAHLYVRRVLCIRRSYHHNKKRHKLSDVVLDEYGNNKDPEVLNNKDTTEKKAVAGEPRASTRRAIRKQRQPKGPVSYVFVGNNPSEC